MEIGNNVFIGTRSLILLGSRIGDNVIIGAGSVVTGAIPGGGVYAGVPAKRIGDFEYLMEEREAVEKDGRKISERFKEVWDEYKYSGN
ncbi:MAG: DapH/DapD/GlmU-related protein [Eubacterium sp.]